MADTDFATPLYHLCLKKQRRESERAFVQADQSHQPAQAITGRRYAELMSLFGGTDDAGDEARVDGRDDMFPVRMKG